MERHNMDELILLHRGEDQEKVTVRVDKAREPSPRCYHLNIEDGKCLFCEVA